jgi:hypothetical protein
MSKIIFVKTRLHEKDYVGNIAKSKIDQSRLNEWTDKGKIKSIKHFKKIVI